MTAALPPLFVQQLHRAAAQRGRLDPLYQDLSDRLTAILQRLYPVWALAGPGLSDPGHIEIHSRSIYLDTDELLAPREQLQSGPLERRAVLRCLGVALHETFHAKHTKRWAVEHDAELAASADAGSWPQIAGCSRSPGWRPTACATSRPPRSAAASSPARSAPRSPTRWCRASSSSCSPAPSPASRSRATWPDARACTCRRAPNTASSSRAH